MSAGPAPQWTVRCAWMLACAWPVAVHACIFLGAAEWAPRATALAVVLAACLWASATRTSGSVVSCMILATLVAGLVLAAPDLLLYAPPVAINLALAAVFGASLLPARTPVISIFASMEQGGLPPDLARYTRLLTWIWTVLFIAMAGLAAALALSGSLVLWSTFANLASYLLVAILFIGEYGYRRWRFSHYRHATLLELMQNVRRAGLSSGHSLER